jgi:hypothetical protein
MMRVYALALAVYFVAQSRRAGLGCHSVIDMAEEYLVFLKGGRK